MSRPGRTTIPRLAPARQPSHRGARPSESRATARPFTRIDASGPYSAASRSSASPSSAGGTRRDTPMAPAAVSPTAVGACPRSGAQPAPPGARASAAAVRSQPCTSIGHDRTDSRSAAASPTGAPASSRPPETARTAAPCRNACRASSPHSAVSSTVSEAPAPRGAGTATLADPTLSSTGASSPPQRVTGRVSGRTRSPRSGASTGHPASRTGPTVTPGEGGPASWSRTGRSTDAARSATGPGLESRRRAPMPNPPERFTTLYRRRFTPRERRRVTVSACPTPRATSLE